MYKLFENLQGITFGAVGIWTLVGMVVVALIRQKTIVRKLDDEREANLLTERAVEKKDLTIRLDDLEKRMRRRETLHRAERAVDRHKINNFKQCFDSFLMIAESNPDGAAAAVPIVKAMRAEQMKAEAIEAAALQELRIKALDHDIDDSELVSS